MNGFGSLDWDSWLYGAVSAFISGGSNAVITGFTASSLSPKEFNMMTEKFYVLVFAVFACSGLLNFFAFLRTKPLPDVKVVKTIETVEHQKTPSAIVTTTIETTEVNPVKKVN